MFIGEILRTGIFLTNLSNVDPFIFVGYTNYRKLKTEWGVSCDDLFDTENTYKINNVICDFLNRYKEETTYNNMISLNGSWFLDKTNKYIYVHTMQDSSPMCSYFEYLYTFGVSTNGVQYINDVAYIPVVKSFPQIEIEADYVGQSAPTGIVGSVTLNNVERLTVDGKPQGTLDFLLTESIEGNDFIMYDYTNNVLTESCRTNIEKVDISLQDVVISVQDMRMK